MMKSASFGAVTLKIIMTEWDKESFTPVTCTWFSLGDVKMHDKVDSPAPVRLVGLSEHNVLLLVKSTTPAKWFAAVTVIAEFARALTSVEDTAESAMIEKSPASTITVRERSEEHTSELQSQSNLVCRL